MRQSKKKKSNGVCFTTLHNNRTRLSGEKSQCEDLNRSPAAPTVRMFSFFWSVINWSKVVLMVPSSEKIVFWVSGRATSHHRFSLVAFERPPGTCSCEVTYSTFVAAKMVCRGAVVFNFEIILFPSPKMCIYATEDKKQTPPTLPPKGENLLFYHDPEEKQHRDIYYNSPQSPSPTSQL